MEGDWQTPAVRVPGAHVTAINAIETRYAGCRFRSRLEARWAVFFDDIAIPWEYEPQGYLVKQRWEDAEPRAYLPDFYLPSLELWAEVKAVFTPHDLETLCWATLDGDGLPMNPYGGQLTDATRNRQRILLLGSLNPHRGVPSWVLSHHKGDIELSSYIFRSGGGPDYATIWHDANEWWVKPEAICGLLNAGPGDTSPLNERPRLAAAQARFEHGEKGAPTEIRTSLEAWVAQVDYERRKRELQP